MKKLILPILLVVLIPLSSGIYRTLENYHLEYLIDLYMRESTELNPFSVNFSFLPNRYAIEMIQKDTALYKSCAELYSSIERCMVQIVSLSLILIKQIDGDDVSKKGDKLLCSILNKEGVEVDYRSHKEIFTFYLEFYSTESINQMGLSMHYSDLILSEGEHKICET